MEKLYKVEDLAKILRIHPNTVRRWIKEGKVKATRIGRTWYISKESVDKVLEGIPDPRWDV